VADATFLQKRRRELPDRRSEDVLLFYDEHLRKCESRTSEMDSAEISDLQENLHEIETTF
jgi:hypothetical protein